MKNNFARISDAKKRRKDRRGNKLMNITGERYGKLVAIDFAGFKKCGKQKKSTWLCRCDCGNETTTAIGDLRSGHTTSCGCAHRQAVGRINLKHGLAYKCGRLYPLWKSIKYRCFNPKSRSYKNYGGRGITVCEEWRDDFMSFYSWAMQNGYAEEKLPNGLNKLTIDRIDNDGNYEPSNCRFVTNSEQAKNKRRRSGNG